MTDDGAETDLDLGHYERFTHARMTRAEQLHDRPHLRGGHLEGAARRVPRRDGPGDSAHHRRDQGARPRRPPRAPTSRSSRSAARSATSSRCRSSRPSASSRSSRAAERAQRARHARALHRDRGRAEDQADAALREGDARDRHPARHPALPLRPPALAATSRRRSRSSPTSPVDARHRGDRRRAASTSCRSRLHAEGLDDQIAERLNIWSRAAGPRRRGSASSSASRSPRAAP